MTVAEGRAAARLCALNILAQAKAAIGSLDRIAQIVRLNGLRQRRARSSPTTRR